MDVASSSVEEVAGGGDRTLNPENKGSAYD